MRITPRKGNKDLFILYKKLSTCSRLKNLYVNDIKHKTRDFSKLLSIIPHLNRLNLYGCHLSSYQLTSVYQQITNLQLLILNDDHRDVPANALTLTQVKTVKLENAFLSSEQLNFIYQEISSSSNCKLKYLLIGQSDHTNVDSKLLISAFSKLKQVNLTSCKISFEHLMSILLAIDRKEIKLEHISLFSNYNYLTLKLRLGIDLMLRLEKLPVAIDLRWEVPCGAYFYKHFYTIRKNMSSVKYFGVHNTLNLFQHKVESLYV